MRTSFHEKLTNLIYKMHIALFFVIVFYNGKSQSYYSTDSAYISSKTERNNILTTYSKSYPDTEIYNLHNYFSRNFLGNIGLPSPTYLLNYGTTNLGFNFYPTPNQNDKFFESQIHYYKTKGPYANLTGITGSKKLQIFKLLYTQSYKEKANITLRFNRYTDAGFYLKQQTYTNNFYLSSNFSTKKDRFGYYFYILTNSNKNKENGGIKEQILNSTSLMQNKELLMVNLNGATRENREFKAMINPYYRLNKLNDSAQKTNHFIQIKSTFSSNKYKYTDYKLATDKFYFLNYFNSDTTKDSSHVIKFTNEINYSAITTHSNFAFSFGYKNELNKVWQLKDSIFYNHSVNSDIVYKTTISSKNAINIIDLQTHFNCQYIFEGANKGNYKFEAQSVVTLNPQKKQYIYFNLLTEKRAADYIYNFWTSNHFQWHNNNYKPQVQSQAMLGLDLNKNLSTSLFIQNINNYLYFNNVGLPEQYVKPLTNFGFSLNYTKVVLKHLGLAIDYRLQQTSNPTYIRLPKNQATAKLFYTGILFKNNLQLQIGGQLQVYEAFYSYAYMPANQVFYLQENFKTTPYPFLDVYINARIRPVSFFIKVENTLQGFVGTNYALSPGYYQTDRAFRFGISWSFFD